MPLDIKQIYDAMRELSQSYDAEVQHQGSDKHDIHLQNFLQLTEWYLTLGNDPNATIEDVICSNLAYIFRCVNYPYVDPIDPIEELHFTNLMYTVYDIFDKYAFVHQEMNTDQYRDILVNGGTFTLSGEAYSVPSILELVVTAALKLGMSNEDKTPYIDNPAKLIVMYTDRILDEGEKFFKDIFISNDLQGDISYWLTLLYMIEKYDNSLRLQKLIYKIKFFQAAIYPEDVSNLHESKHQSLNANSIAEILKNAALNSDVNDEYELSPGSPGIAIKAFNTLTYGNIDFEIITYLKTLPGLSAEVTAELEDLSLIFMHSDKNQKQIVIKEVFDQFVNAAFNLKKIDKSMSVSRIDGASILKPTELAAYSDFKQAREAKMPKDTIEKQFEILKKKYADKYISSVDPVVLRMQIDFLDHLEAEVDDLTLHIELLAARLMLINRYKQVEDPKKFEEYFNYLTEQHSAAEDYRTYMLRSYIGTSIYPQKDMLASWNRMYWQHVLLVQGLISAKMDTRPAKR